jgi:MATE family multidrug resistance protein
MPVLVSMVAEPLAGLADTAFVARLGATELAAVGVGATLLSSVLWIFNFLGIGTQTEVAHSLGEGSPSRVSGAASLALALCALLGLVLVAAGWPLIGPAAAWMSDAPGVRSQGEIYLRIRLLGAPFALLLLGAFGVLRGLQDMRTPLGIAAAMSVTNVALDPLLIFGAGPVPALGVAGAAWATTATQALAALWALAAVARRVPLTRRIEWQRARALLVVGRDMVVRTAALLCFMLFATRASLQAGVEAGAAHQAVRQVWTLLAFLLDAYAIVAQSLVGYFLGAGRSDLALRVARISCAWGLATGAALAIALLGIEGPTATLLVPVEARAVFASAWVICALTQPLNALSFVTDGIHWGSGDFAWLRNAMLASTAVGLLALAAVDPDDASALARIWAVTAVWIALRSLFGIVRIWPGLGSAALRVPSPGAH